MAGAESGTRGGRGRGQVAGQVRSQDTVLMTDDDDNDGVQVPGSGLPCSFMDRSSVPQLVGY